MAARKKYIQEVPQEMPLVSVVIAAYNMAKYLPESIESALNQTYPALEVLVMDDGSTDATPSVLDRYRDDPRVHTFRQQNSGQTKTKNRLIRKARGTFIAFLDADDAWLPGKLELQMSHFRDPEVGVVFGNMIYVDGNGDELPIQAMPAYSGWITDKLLIDNFVSFPTVVVRKQVFDELGAFDETLSMAIDYELWLRVSLSYKFVHVDRPLARYRIWAGQMSNKQEERFDNFFRMLDRFIKQHGGRISSRAIRAGYGHSYASRGWWHKSEGRRLKAIGDFGRALWQYPADIRSWRFLAATVLGR